MPLFDLLVLLFGGVILLFIPGYSLTIIFFRDDELAFIERLTLSIALSLVSVPFLVLMANQTLRMKINPTNVSIIILLIVASALYLRSRSRRPVV